MDTPYRTLRLNGSQHGPDELLKLAEQIFNSESVAGWRKKLYLFFRDWLSPDPFLEVTTSGSTGRPKTLPVSKHIMVRSAARTGEAFGLSRGDRALLCLPVDYIAGKMMVVRAFVLGLDLIPLNPTSDPLAAYQGTAEFAALTPMQVYRTLQRENGKQQLNGIKTLIIGGAGVDENLIRSLRDLDTNIYHTYGMTETLTHVALRRLNGSRPESCFTALPGVFFSTNAEGCLVVHDPALGNDALETNDFADLLTPNTFTFQGRQDLVINSGGKKILPEAVEEKIRKFLPYRFVILGKKDQELGEKVVLVIETRGADLPENLAGRLGKASLHPHEIPKEIIRVDHFPESPGGKIRRKDIKV